MTLEKGKTYQVKLTSGAWVIAEFLSEDTDGGFAGNDWTLSFGASIRKRTTYHFRNLRTGRTITLRSQRKVKQIPEGGAQ